MALHVRVARELQVMDSGSRCFDHMITPQLRPIVMSIPPAQRQAWWDGFLASLVGAMGVTIGETATQECCTDLYTRARDFAADLKKQQPQ